MSKSKTTAAPALTYERVRVDSLSEDPANVRIHPERNLEAIKASLRASGQQKPIVVDRRGIVIAGNGTLRAARALGWEEIDIVRSNLEGPAAVAFSIADNRTAELAEWDVENLPKILAELGEEAAMDAGFSQAELAAMLDIGKTEGGLDTTSGVAMTSTPQDYEQLDSRQIILIYNSEQYARVIARLDEERERLAVRTYSEVVLALLSV